MWPPGASLAWPPSREMICLVLPEINLCRSGMCPGMEGRVCLTPRGHQTRGQEEVFPSCKTSKRSLGWGGRSHTSAWILSPFLFPSTHFHKQGLGEVHSGAASPSNFRTNLPQVMEGKDFLRMNVPSLFLRVTGQHH